MPTWTPQELSSVGRAHEIRVAGRRKDGSLRSHVPVWHVVVDGALYARSVKGTEGQWYKGVTRHFEGAVNWGRPATSLTRTGSRGDPPYPRGPAALRRP
jgi:hypothetical protein